MAQAHKFTRTRKVIIRKNPDCLKCGQEMATVWLVPPGTMKLPKTYFWCSPCKTGWKTRKHKGLPK